MVDNIFFIDEKDNKSIKEYDIAINKDLSLLLV
jgi:hypothetical protein